jgi:hypothetical protein
MGIFSFARSCSLDELEEKIRSLRRILRHFRREFRELNVSERMYARKVYIKWCLKLDKLRAARELFFTPD